MLALVATGCRKKETAAPPEVEVQTTLVRRTAITEHIDVDGILSPIAQAAISPRISAPIKEFLVQRGSKVSKGQLLAVLENRDLDAALVDSRGNYDAAQAEYQIATDASVPAETQKAKLDLAQAQANLNLNLQIVKSRKKLFAEGAISGRELDTAQAELVQAQAAYELAQQHFDAVEKVSHAATLKSARGQLESAKGKYLGAEAQVQYSEIRSPVAGVVTDRPLFAGETAVAGTPLLTVMDISSLIAKVHLTQAQTQGLEVGDPAAVTIPGADAPVAGKLSLISPALDPGSTTVEVWVQVTNPDGRLKPGTSVHVLIAGKNVSDALVVPTGSLITAPDGGKAVMIVGRDGAAHLKEVSTGLADDGLVQILSGVFVGDQVITKGAYALDDGTKVKVVTAADGAGKADAGGDRN